MSVAFAAVIASAEEAIRILEIVLAGAGGLAVAGFGTAAIIFVGVALWHAINQSNQ